MNTNGQTEEHRQEGVGQHVDKATAAASEFYEEARATGQGLMDAVDIGGRVQRNPYGMVATAIGIGYLLGGGLFTPTTGRLVRMGLKLAAFPLVRSELMTLAESALDGVLDRARSANASPKE